MAKVMMINKKTGEIKPGFYGICWSYLFLGPIVPWMREGFGTAVKHLLYIVITLSIYGIVQIFSYNKNYTKRMLRDGWNLGRSDAENRLAATALGVAYERVTETQVGKKFS